MIKKIEDFMNALTDMDWGWWPVLFLRPEKDKDIDNVILLKLSLVVGSILGYLVYLMNLESAIFSNVVISILLGCVLFFVFYKFTFAYFWNRRALRIRED